MTLRRVKGGRSAKMLPDFIRLDVDGKVQWQRSAVTTVLYIKHKFESILENFLRSLFDATTVY